MKNNEHSIKVWELIFKFAIQWNIRNWSPFSEEVVVFSIKNYNFAGKISIQEITNAYSDKYGLFAVAFLEQRTNLPVIQFLARGEVANFIDSFCQLNWNNELAVGERAPNEMNLTQAA